MWSMSMRAWPEVFISFSATACSYAMSQFCRDPATANDQFTAFWSHQTMHNPLPQLHFWVRPTTASLIPFQSVYSPTVLLFAIELRFRDDDIKTFQDVHLQTGIQHLPGGILGYCLLPTWIHSAFLSLTLSIVHVRPLE